MRIVSSPATEFTLPFFFILSPNWKLDFADCQSHVRLAAFRPLPIGAISRPVRIERVSGKGSRDLSVIRPLSLSSFTPILQGSYGISITTPLLPFVFKRRECRILPPFLPCFYRRMWGEDLFPTIPRSSHFPSLFKGI